MSMNTATATARLQRELPAAEAAIDTAMLQVSATLHTAITAKQDTGYASTTAHAALLRMHRSMGELIDAAGELRRAHGELVKVGVEVGVMDAPECPERHMGNLASQGGLRSAA
ncbi:hypothetical protein [Porphyrobacter sp. GA68]|uniref:hypothetical protein n=1 Tax=Porphyrobacter sp. GA68 TaxID=2883480 RepID=UPI001D19454E|nr:hypothetical protein [Porphyrobacter sp. GA68]